MARERVRKTRGRRFITSQNWNKEQSERVGTRSYMAFPGEDDFDWQETLIDPGPVGASRNRSGERTAIPNPIRLP